MFPFFETSRERCYVSTLGKENKLGACVNPLYKIIGDANS